MTAVLAVLPDAYRFAARNVGDECATLVRLAASQLMDALSDTAGMAGSDDCGRQWGDSYDQAACAAFSSMTDAYNALQVVGDLLDQTAANYAGAESASAGGVIVGREFRAEQVTTFGSPPSSMGQGGVDVPGGWSVIEAFVHRAWPNGHQDRLHHAGAAWTRAGAELQELVLPMDEAALALRPLRAPEIDDATIVIDSLRDQLIDLGHACVSIGNACHAYAHHLDAAHHKIIQALEDLARETAETVAVGTLFAIVTAGAGAVAAGVAEANIVRSAAQAIAAIIDLLLSYAVTLAAEADVAATRIAAVADTVRPILARQAYESEVIQSRIRGDGLIIGRVLAPVTEEAYTAGSTTIPERALADLQSQLAALRARVDAGSRAPRLFHSVIQLRRKFKHAPAFGVTGTPSASGLERYAKALEHFVDSPSTTTVLGTYRKQRCFLSYDQFTAQIVVRKLDGEFVSAWQMTSKQEVKVYLTGDLGGG